MGFSVRVSFLWHSLGVKYTSLRTVGLSIGRKKRETQPDFSGAVSGSTLRESINCRCRGGALRNLARGQNVETRPEWSVLLITGPQDVQSRCTIGEEEKDVPEIEI